MFMFLSGVLPAPGGNDVHPLTQGYADDEVEDWKKISVKTEDWTEK